MFLHIFNTWLLSNFFHPFVFLLLSMMRNNSTDIFDPEIFAIGLIFFGASLLLSLPCLLLGWLCLYLINTSPFSGGIKFIVWLVTGPSLVFFEFLFILFVTNEIEIKILLFSIPAITAAGVAILIRHGQFGKLVYIPKIDNHETNLV